MTEDVLVVRAPPFERVTYWLALVVMTGFAVAVDSVALAVPLIGVAIVLAVVVQTARVSVAREGVESRFWFRRRNLGWAEIHGFRVESWRQSTVVVAVLRGGGTVRLHATRGGFGGWSPFAIRGFAERCEALRVRFASGD